MSIKLGQRVAGGYEKEFYGDPLAEKKLFAHIHTSDGQETGQETANQTKARYYVQKILHLLFPENIPDIHLGASTKKGSFLRVEKITVDDAHKALQKKIDAIELGYAQGNSAELVSLDQISEEEINRESQPRIKELIKKLEPFFLNGVDVISGRNYAINEKGNAVFLDNQVPWKSNEGFNNLKINLTKINDAIDNLSEPNKTQARKYYNRLIALYSKSSNEKNNTSSEDQNIF